MGNWRKVTIVGTCGEQDVPALRKSLTFDRNTYADFHCLCNGGIAGLPNWAGTTINVTGNLGERGYDADSVAEQLEEIAQTVPSLAVKVHVGNDYEADDCIATVTLAEGVATVGPAEVPKLGEIDGDQMRRNLMSQLNGGGS